MSYARLNWPSRQLLSTRKYIVSYVVHSIVCCMEPKHEDNKKVEINIDHHANLVLAACHKGSAVIFEKEQIRFKRRASDTTAIRTGRSGVCIRLR